MLTQNKLDKFHADIVDSYLATITTAPFKQKRIFGQVIEAAWQVERKFADSLRRIVDLATQYKLNSHITEEDIRRAEQAGERPGLLDE